jgi:hypothetical protein
LVFDLAKRTIGVDYSRLDEFEEMVFGQGGKALKIKLLYLDRSNRY